MAFGGAFVDVGCVAITIEKWLKVTIIHNLTCCPESHCDVHTTTHVHGDGHMYSASSSLKMVLNN